MQEFQTPSEIVGLPVPKENENNMDISGRHSVMFGATASKSMLRRNSELVNSDPQDDQTAAHVIYGPSQMAASVPIKDLDVVIEDYNTK